MSEVFLSIIVSGIALLGVIATAVFGYMGRSKQANIDAIATRENLECKLREELSKDRDIFRDEATKFRGLYFKQLEINREISEQGFVSGRENIKLVDKIKTLESMVDDLEKHVNIIK